jgi:hypothetical protein
MNSEDIIRMAKEFGVWGPFMGEDEDLERFFQAAYAAGAAAERNACLEVRKKMIAIHAGEEKMYSVDELLRHMETALDDYAAAIRARGQA